MAPLAILLHVYLAATTGVAASVSNSDEAALIQRVRAAGTKGNLSSLVGTEARGQVGVGPGPIQMCMGAFAAYDAVACEGKHLSSLYDFVIDTQKMMKTIPSTDVMTKMVKKDFQKVQQKMTRYAKVAKTVAQTTGVMMVADTLMGVADIALMIVQLEQSRAMMDMLKDMKNTLDHIEHVVDSLNWQHLKDKLGVIQANEAIFRQKANNINMPSDAYYEGLPEYFNSTAGMADSTRFWGLAANGTISVTEATWQLIRRYEAYGGVSGSPISDGLKEIIQGGPGDIPPLATVITQYEAAVTAIAEFTKTSDGTVVNLRQFYNVMNVLYGQVTSILSHKRRAQLSYRQMGEMLGESSGVGIEIIPSTIDTIQDGYQQLAIYIWQLYSDTWDSVGDAKRGVVRSRICNLGQHNIPKWDGHTDRCGYRTLQEFVDTNRVVEDDGYDWRQIGKCTTWEHPIFCAMDDDRCTQTVHTRFGNVGRFGLGQEFEPARGGELDFQELFSSNPTRDQREAEINITTYGGSGRWDGTCTIKATVTFKPLNISKLPIISDHTAYMISAANDVPVSWVAVRETEGHDLKEGDWDGYKYLSRAACQAKADKAGVYYYSWSNSVYNGGNPSHGFCKVQKQTVPWPELSVPAGNHGYKLWSLRGPQKWNQVPEAQGRDLYPGEFDGFKNTSQIECQAKADQAGVFYYAWSSSIYYGFCKVQMKNVSQPEIAVNTTYGYRLWAFEGAPLNW